MNNQEIQEWRRLFKEVFSPFNINITVSDDCELEPALSRIEHKLGQIMATQAEEAAKLTALSAQLSKANDEIQKAIADLKTALDAAGNTSPEVDAATDALTMKAQALDDIVPDAPTP